MSCFLPEVDAPGARKEGSIGMVWNRRKGTQGAHCRPEMQVELLRGLLL